MLSGEDMPGARSSVSARFGIVGTPIEEEGDGFIGDLIDREGRALKIYRVSYRLLDALGENQVMSIAIGRRFDAQFRMTDIEAARQSLRTCQDDLLTSWGVDVASLRSLSAQPEPANYAGNWVTYEDYPEEAVRAEMSGTTFFKLEVDAEGDVESCEVIISSGFAVLDQNTCRLVTRRAHFNPARDANGNPVPSAWFNSVRYWTAQD